MAGHNEDEVLSVENAEGADNGEALSASAPVTIEEDQTPEEGSASPEVAEASSPSDVLKAKEAKAEEAVTTAPETKVSTVDNIEVEFTHSIKFMHAGLYYDFRGGEKAKVSDDLYKILWERGCIKPVIR